MVGGETGVAGAHRTVVGRAPPAAAQVAAGAHARRRQCLGEEHLAGRPAAVAVGVGPAREALRGPAGPVLRGGPQVGEQALGAPLRHRRGRARRCGLRRPVAGRVGGLDGPPVAPPRCEPAVAPRRRAAGEGGDHHVVAADDVGGDPHRVAGRLPGEVRRRGRRRSCRETGRCRGGGRVRRRRDGARHALPAGNAALVDDGTVLVGVGERQVVGTEVEPEGPDAAARGHPRVRGARVGRLATTAAGHDLGQPAGDRVAGRVHGRPALVLVDVPGEQQGDAAVVGQ